MQRPLAHVARKREKKLLKTSRAMNRTNLIGCGDVTVAAAVPAAQAHKATCDDRCSERSDYFNHRYHQQGS
jgi:Tfp pilus assembly protein PilV